MGLAGPWGADGEVLFRGLLEGRHPDGARLVRPVWRRDPRSRVPAAPLVAVVRSRARAAGVMVDVVLGEPRLCRAYGSAARSLSGRGPRTLTGVPVQVALDILERVGADSREVYPASSGGSDPVAAALAHAGERVDAGCRGWI